MEIKPRDIDWKRTQKCWHLAKFVVLAQNMFFDASVMMHSFFRRKILRVRETLLRKEF